MKKHHYIILGTTLLTVAIVFCITQSQKIMIKNTINSYYKESYAAWLELRYPDYEGILDFNFVQPNNILVQAKKTIDEYNYMIDHGIRTKEQLNKRKKEYYNVVFKDFDVNETSAVVHIEIVLDSALGTPIAYPYFISGGENIFYLQKNNRDWLITEHQNCDNINPTPSTTETEIYNQEKFFEQLDQLYRSYTSSK